MQTGHAADADRSASITAKRKGGARAHPVLIVLAMMAIAVVLTHIIPAGKFERRGEQVVAGGYHAIPKASGLSALLSTRAPSASDVPARAAGVATIFTAIPAGMVKAAPLFFMIMFVGGAFGVLRATGALDAGVDRMLQLTSGNAYLLTMGLVVLLACGSTFLGFSSEYIALIPVVMAIGRRLGLPNLYAPAVIALADFIGYTTSVTNPIVLGIAQPLAGVPVFSGMAPRLTVFLVLLALGLVHVARFLHGMPRVAMVIQPSRLTVRQSAVLITLLFGGVALVVGTSAWHWESPQLAAAFIALGVMLAVAGGLRPEDAADAFLDGMRAMLLPCLLIGLGTAVALVLQASQVMDSIVQGIAVTIQGGHRGVVGMAMMAAEMAFGVLIPSAAAKAAVSVPILTPIAHLSGVGGQVTVTALLLGSGMTNMITPTNPLLLAFLAAADVRYGEWVRFIAPLFLVFTAVCFAAIFLMTIFGA